MLEHFTRIFNLSTISSFETRTLNYSTRVYWHQIGCEIASYSWECRICHGEHRRTGCIKISSSRTAVCRTYDPDTDTRSRHSRLEWGEDFTYFWFTNYFVPSYQQLAIITNGLPYLVTFLRTSSLLNCKSHLFVLNVALASARSDKTQLLYHFFSYCVN